MKSELSAPAGWAPPALPRRLPAVAPAVLLVAATALLLVAGALWPTWRAVAWWLLPLLGLGAVLHARARCGSARSMSAANGAPRSTRPACPWRNGSPANRSRCRPAGRRGWDRSIPPIRWPG
ncbi:hypothetical protein ACFJIX_16555 [Roseateles sp. UC29_93]|uniref:hypothetical protein n=1 Tax=Roseateles sp. UC29_93 TaxID=3350177 RepID=UPI0036709893